jgi:hypothetical protein
MHDETTNVKTMGDGTVQRARRCGACGGLNPPGAAWCGQCLTRFEPTLEKSEAPETEHDAPDAPPPPPHTKGAPSSPPGSTFQVTDAGVTWTCSVCDTVNDLDHRVCQVCGAPFAKTVLPEDEKPQRDPNMVALLSLLLPGAGHAYIGHWGQAIARGVISLWVIMVVFVAALQRGAASSNLVMGVFGLVAFGLWGVGAHDAYREARDERALVILKGKVFFYLVLGLLLLLVALLMTAMIRANG